MRDVLLALFLLSAFPIVIYRYQVGAMVIGFISFMYPQSNTYGFAMSIQWLDLFLVLTVGGYFLKQGYKEYQHHTIISMVMFFYLWVCISTAFGINWMFSYDPWVKFSKICLLAYVVYAMIGTEHRLLAFTKVMVLSLGFYGIKGGLFTILSGGGAHVLGPVNSFYADNNGMALVLNMTLPFMIFFITHAENMYQRYFAIFCSLCTAIAVLGTQSRTGLAALVVTLLYFTWLQKKLARAVLVLVPVALVALFFMPDTWTERMATTTELDSDASFQGRVDMWKASILIANDNPILGGGYNVIYIPEVIARYIPLGTTARAIHSAYFQMIAEHGYGGLLIFAFILWYTFNTARRMAKQTQETDALPWMRDFTVAIRSAIAGYLVLGFTANIAFFDLLYFIMVLTAVADNLLQKELGPQGFNLYAGQKKKKPSQKLAPAARV